MHEPIVHSMRSDLLTTDTTVGALGQHKYHDWLMQRSTEWNSLTDAALVYFIPVGGSGQSIERTLG